MSQEDSGTSLKEHVWMCSSPVTVYQRYTDVYILRIINSTLYVCHVGSPTYPLTWVLFYNLCLLYLTLSSKPWVHFILPYTQRTTGEDDSDIVGCKVLLLNSGSSLCLVLSRTTKGDFRVDVVNCTHYVVWTVNCLPGSTSSCKCCRKTVLYGILVSSVWLRVVFVTKN